MAGLRIGGLASGMDVDGFVNQMKQVWRRPATVMEKRRSRLSTQMFAWRDVSSRIGTLKTKLNALDNSNLFGGRTASVSDGTVFTAAASSTAAPASYSINVTQLAGARKYQSTLTTISDPEADTGYAGTVDVVNGDGSVRGSFTIDGATGSSLNDIATVINNSAGTLKLKASVTATKTGEYHLVVQGTEIGWDKRFRFSNAAGTLMQDLGVVDGAGGDVAGAMVQDAANTEFTIDGLAYSRGGLSVGDAISGVTLNFAKTGTAALSVAEDLNSPLSAIKNFVSQFNAVIDFIGEKTKFDPKTKAAGELLGEAGITNLGGGMRARLMNDVAGLPTGMNSLLDIGIKTGNGGQLVVDEAKLTSLLKSDPNGVRAIFQTATTGVADAFGSWLDFQSGAKGMLPGRAKALEKSIKAFDDRIKYFDEVLMPKKEDQLRKQMTRMEKSLAIFQNQGSWLSSQLAGLG